MYNTSPPSGTSLPQSPHPTPLGSRRQAELPVSSSRFSLALCLTHGSAYMLIPISQPVLPNFTPAPLVHLAVHPFFLKVTLVFIVLKFEASSFLPTQEC